MAYSTGQCSGFTAPGVRCKNGGGCTDDHKNPKQSQSKANVKAQADAIATQADSNSIPAITDPCDGMCVTAADVGLPGYGDDAIAYPHPGCPRHDPDAVCDCGNPDRCMSPTHGQISHAEALRIRHSQNPSDSRVNDSGLRVWADDEQALIDAAAEYAPPFDVAAEVDSDHVLAKGSCSNCDGLGYHAATINRQPCSACKGSGSVPDLMAALERSIERARAVRQNDS